MSIPRTMKAAILVEQRKPLIIDDVTLPEALEIGQVLVKVHFSGICGSQIGEIDGAKGEDKFLPHLLGHEASGTVIDIGPGVKHVKPGDLVVLHWRKGVGIEGAPPVYLWRGQKLNAGWITTFNEYAIISENRVTPIPSDSDREVAALFGCAVTTGFGVVENNAKIKIGNSVVVFGAGGVGLNIVQAAALVGGNPVIAVDLYENKLALAKKMGATHIINSSQEDAVSEIKKIIGGKGIDVFIDNTGQPNVIEMGYQIINEQGDLVLVGVPKLGNKINIYTLPIHFGKRICGSHGGEIFPSSDIKRYMNFISDKGIDLRTIITDRYRLEEINECVSSMKNGTAAGRIIVSME